MHEVVERENVLAGEVDGVSGGGVHSLFEHPFHLRLEAFQQLVQQLQHLVDALVHAHQILHTSQHALRCTPPSIPYHKHVLRLANRVVVLLHQLFHVPQQQFH